MQERGNALFLILIAVALFAALSYAVTSSGRGSGSISGEQSLITSAQITQFSASLRTTVLRMVLTGTNSASLRFDTSAPVGVDEVFAKEGGGNIYQAPPANIGGATAWVFKDLSDPVNGFFIDEVGPTGRDIFAALSPLSLSMCQQINRGLNMNLALTGHNTSSLNLTEGYVGKTFPDDQNEVYSTDGNPFACFEQSPDVYYYYHLLVE